MIVTRASHEEGGATVQRACLTARQKEASDQGSGCRAHWAQMPARLVQEWDDQQIREATPLARIGTPVDLRQKEGTIEVDNTMPWRQGSAPGLGER